MNFVKPKALEKGDEVAIVSLSSGMLGEDFTRHSKVLMERRLRDDLGLSYHFTKHSLHGIDFIANHPEKRAEDLKEAFLRKSAKVVWSVIGGDDTFRTLPFLMNDEFKDIVSENPKIFIGFSDTTVNHLLFSKMGLTTYYGPALLTDVAELGKEIHPFTREWIGQLFNPTSDLKVKSSPIWYSERDSYGENQLGIESQQNAETRGFEFINGSGRIEGKLLGGCIESLYEILSHERYPDQKEIFDNFPIFPTAKEWKDKILFIESSEERPSPQKYQKMINSLENQGVFDAVKAIIVGKPQDEVYYDEYKEILKAISAQYDLPVVYNMNFGHSSPRMILPYNQKIILDFDNKTVTLPEPLVSPR
jgi:muramoyltetrapeptide carboxypeptidase LdcA involved in peptidoglycan recycling